MIRVTDDYVIDTDENSYILQQDLHTTYTDKMGKTRHNYKNIGYYTSLNNALEGLKEVFARKCIGEGEKTLSEALQSLRDINADFEKLISK